MKLDPRHLPRFDFDLGTAESAPRNTITPRERPSMRSVLYYRTLLGVSLAFAASTVGAGANAEFIPLGDLPGGDVSSHAVDVSDDGSVVIGNSTGASGSEVFRWTSDTGMVGLGIQSAVAASADGSVIVGSGFNGSFTEAYRWTAATGIVGLGDLPGGNDESFATAVSDDGTVVVGMSRSANGTEAFRWTSVTGMIGIGDTPGGNFYSIAYGVSGDGSVIVGGSDNAFTLQPFRWTSSTGFVDLGTPSMGFSWASAVSADGATIVGVGGGGVPGVAMRWTNATGWIDLGVIDSPIVYSTPTGVSGDGNTVVGYVYPYFGPQIAMIWTPESGMRDFRQALIDDFGLGAELAGWRLGSASAISPDGRFIVGGGKNPSGVNEAWLVRLPAPDPGETPPGTDVVVAPETVDENGDPFPGPSVVLTFDEVTTAGSTTVTASLVGPATPSGFRLGDPPLYVDIQTTAIFNGLIAVCVDYSDVVFSGDPADLVLGHYANGMWENITTSNDTTNRVICGVTDSLSPFAILRPAGALELLDGLDTAVAAVGSNQATKLALQALLRPVRRVLTDTRTRNDPVAIVLLNVFSRAVERLSGRRLGETEADELIAMAGEIIAVLNGSTSF